MNADKREFYRLAAKRFAASTFIYKVDALVHVEDEDDVWFWSQILAAFRPGKYKFLPGSNNEKLLHTTGCIQCLKYKDFLSQRFFICIDSDLRFLLGENISAKQGILQTYTYSWENHCCLAEKLQDEFSRLTRKGKVFDFSIFLKNFSEILYRPFLLMLYCEQNRVSEFDRKKFRQLISLQYRKGDDNETGTPILNRLKKDVSGLLKLVAYVTSEILKNIEGLCISKGVKTENVYLYVLGHTLYNLINSIGNKLCEGTGVDFEESILKTLPPFEGYEPIEKIKNDISTLNTIRRVY